MIIRAEGRTQELAVSELGYFYDSSAGGGSFNINTDSWTPLPWDTELIEGESYRHDGSSSKVLIKDGGLYRITYNVTHLNQDAGSDKNVHCSLRINGSDFRNVDASSYSYGGGSDSLSNFGSGFFELNQNDYYEIVCQRVGTSGSSNLLSGIGGTWTNIELIRRQ